MAADEDPTTFHTSQEESLRQAEAAFGGEASETPVLGGEPAKASVLGGEPAKAPVLGGEPSKAPVFTRVPQAPSGIPGVPRRRFPPGRLILALLPVLVIGGVALGGYLFVKDVVDDATNPISVPTLPAIPSVPNLPTPPDSPSSPGTPSSPGGSTSNFTLAGLARSKATARRLAGAGARIELARVTSDQLQVIARSGSTRKVVLVSAGFTRAISTPGGALTGNEFAFESFNPGVAGHLVRTLGRRYNLRSSRIGYMVVIRNPVTKALQWLVYPQGGGGHFQADARGGSLRRVG